PPVPVIGLRSADPVPYARRVPWTVALDVAPRGSRPPREQVLLPMHQRGVSTHLQSPASGVVRTCPRCAIALTLPQPHAARRLRSTCHHALRFIIELTLNGVILCENHQHTRKGRITICELLAHFIGDFRALDPFGGTVKF